MTDLFFYYNSVVFFLQCRLFYVVCMYEFFIKGCLYVSTCTNEVFLFLCIFYFFVCFLSVFYIFLLTAYFPLFPIFSKLTEGENEQKIFIKIFLISFYLTAMSFIAIKLKIVLLCIFFRLDTRGSKIPS